VYQLSPVTMAIPAILYKKRFKVKILFYCLDLWPDSLAARGIKQNSIVYRFFLKVSRWIYRSADELLVSSSMFIDYFKNHLNIKTLQINHLPQYAIEVHKENLLDIPLGKVNGSYNFVFAGNIGFIQSVETIIFAANELKDFSNINFHIIGNGSNLINCQNLSKEFKLCNIKFYGRRPPEEMPYFYSMADAMLVTLKINNVISLTLPGKIQSYMAFSKPIIGAIDGETKVVIQKASCGFTCEAENYKELARLITEFCTKNPNEIYQMGVNARKYYLDNFDKKLFMNSLEFKLTKLFKD
jgi:glycosyltransferase involved in cell wall biosynthesis